MDRGLVGGAGDDVQGRVEDDVPNDGVPRSASQCLQRLPTICAKNFDDCASLGGGCDQGAVWVDAQGTELGLVRLDHTGHAVLSHWKQETG